MFELLLAVLILVMVADVAGGLAYGRRERECRLGMHSGRSSWHSLRSRGHRRLQASPSLVASLLSPDNAAPVPVRMAASLRLVSDHPAARWRHGTLAVEPESATWRGRGVSLDLPELRIDGSREVRRGEWWSISSDSVVYTCRSADVALDIAVAKVHAEGFEVLVPRIRS